MASDTQMDIVPAETKFTGIRDETLKLYYERLFPFGPMFRWLSYCNLPDTEDPLSEKDFFMRREFSFTLAGDVYIRYLTFKNQKEYKDAYIKRLPHKTDIGAIFNAPPKHHNAISSFKPVEKELVFDIDMTDYDDVRNCCSDAKICLRCWKLMNIAIKVLDRALREDFGFEHLLWIYSGRRGVHCWVCDERARKLNDSGRAAVVSYLSAYTGGEKAQKVRLTNPIHPSLAEALTVTEPEFETYCQEQGLFQGEDRWKKILEMIPDPAIRQELHQKWKNQGQPETKSQLADIQKAIKKDISTKKFSKLRNTFEEIIFAHLYPRLDVNVSKGMNHLLKSPWSVHPKTGRVCVPIDPRNCEDFNPLTVPTIDDLIRDIDNYKGKEVSDWQKTQMKPYVEFFKNKFLKQLESSIRTERRRLAQKYDMEF